MLEVDHIAFHVLRHRRKGYRNAIRTTEKPEMTNRKQEFLPKISLDGFSMTT